MADTTDPFRYDGERDASRPAVAVGSSWSNDEADNPCFGCRQHGPAGLRLTFTRTAPDTVESLVNVDHQFAGWASVIHGGIQSALLDEVMGATAWAHLGGTPDVAIVTVELTIRYHRPAPIAADLVVRGVLDRVEGRDLHTRGEIVGPGGTVLTSATSTWRRVR